MQKTYVALDLETTGLSPMRDHILEIGAMRVEEGEVTGTYSTFVDVGMEIPPNITQLTGITREMTLGSPNMQEAVEGFLQFSKELPLLGHNILFDYGFMKRNVHLLGESYQRRGIDTLTIARSCLTHLPSRSLDKVAAYLDIPQEHHHRALDDALTAARIYERLAEEFEEERPELFETEPLQFKIRKESPITNSQKGYLRDLLKYHRIECNLQIETMTKSEASRMIDKIILQYGKIMR